jgi:hypothetical protein
LLKNMVKDVLEVEYMRSIADVDKLRGHLPMHTRCLVIRDPKFGREEQLEEETGVQRWAVSDGAAAAGAIASGHGHVGNVSSERRVEIVEVGVLGGNKEGVDSDSEE